MFADDADLVAHTEEGIQLVMDIFSKACFALGLTINLKKTKVTYLAKFMLSPTSRWKVIDLMSWIVLSILEACSVELAVLMLKYFQE